MTGMEQNNDSLGRDTRMCGDPLFWFPMRVTYSRELKVKAELNRLDGIKVLQISSLPLDPRLSTAAQPPSSRPSTLDP